MDKIREILIGLGLSDTEARLYLAMLKLGPASVQNIAKEASLSRTATYDLIAGLQKKGLASTYDCGKKTFYSVEDPGTLDRYFRDRMVDVNTKLVELRQALPELRAMHGGARPRVRYYHGVEGLRTMFRDVVESRPSELFEMVNVDSIYSHLNTQLLKELRDVENFKNIKIRTIAQTRPRNPTINAEIRYVQKAMEVFSGNLWIYNDRVAFADPSGEIDVFVIENAVFSQMMKVAFESIWVSADKFFK